MVTDETRDKEVEESGRPEIESEESGGEPESVESEAARDDSLEEPSDADATADATAAENGDAKGQEGPPAWEDPPGPEAVCVEVVYRAEDLAAPSRWNMTRGGWLVRRALSGIFNVLIGASLWFDPFGMGSAFEFGWMSTLWTIVQWVGLLAMILGGLLAFRLGYTVWVIYRSPEKLWPGVQQKAAKARFAVDARAFRLGMEENQKTYEWSAVRRVERWKAWYLVETTVGEWIIVPQRGFEGDQEERFQELVRQAGVGGELSA